ncbi:carbon-nitrogen hydrolase family protein [Halobaculum magnesiiphilum]|uniref:Carbon-nitrogen hydrolase family protein n=1 Tax=Halobaculum magnesiiphilum TaxID=1017351 RepID=A0A8T8WI99_9EURY|nr:carbon-nitrogen hydrolase family protein [Halobaculum magnesiiphilum]QZP39567.1 carbon-nitrogen hydrolase family protein [Halobaculum magnesiiphilum]
MTPRVAACQFEPVVDSLDANYDRIETLTEQVNADLAVFPELCVTGYDLSVARKRATPVPGELTSPLIDIASRTDTELVVGLPERDGDALYNVFVLVDGSGVQATYRKRYPWGDEPSVFDTGTGPVVADTSVGRIGFLLCYDLNFPELALEYAERDCDVLAVGAAWRTSFRGDWRLLLRSRALDGPCYTIGANHVGDQRGREHAGESLVAGPKGEVLVETGTASDAAVTTVDSSELDAAMERNPVRETRQELSSE